MRREGETISVRIVGIREYGVFIQTVDEPYQNGLIHISQIKNDYIEDIYQEFEIGQIVPAKIVSLTTEGKLSLTTKENYETKKENQYIVKKLANVFGKLSSKAVDMLDELCLQYSVENIDTVVSEMLKKSKEDPGVQFMKELKIRMEDGL